MTPAPRIGKRPMRASGATPGVWYLALKSGAMFTVYRSSHGWWKPFKGTLTRGGVDVVRARAWSAQWVADKLARAALRSGRACRPGRSYPTRCA